MSLRTKWMIVMALGVLIPSLVLAFFALYSTQAAVQAARASTESLLAAAYAGRTRVALDGLARRDASILGRLSSLSVATAAFLAHRPLVLPGTTAGTTPGWRQVHGLNVAIEVPRDFVADPSALQELAAAPYIGAFLEAQNLPIRSAMRVTYVHISGLTWMYPTPRHGATVPDFRTVPEDFAMALPGNDPNLGPVWTPPFRDPLDGRLAVAVLTPVMAPDGTFQGVVDVEVDVASLIQPVRIGAAAGTTLLADPADGTVLGADPGILPVRRLLSLALIRRPFGTKSLRGGTVTVGGVPTFYAAELLAGPRLSLWTFVPQSVLAGLLRSADLRIRRAAFGRLAGVAVLWAVLTALLLGTALRTAGREAKRIQVLAEGVRDFARDRSRRLPTGEDELGRLGKVFNAMADELERLTLHLEEQVERRTEQLNRQALALSRLNALGRRLMTLRSRQAIMEEAVAYLKDLGYRGPRFLAEAENGVSVPVPSGRLHLTVDGEDRLGILPAVAAEVAAALENLRRFALEEERREEARREAVVAERHRLAREIHDTLAQSFLGIVLHARAVSPAGEDSRHHLDRVLELGKKGLEEARRSVWNLSPAVLEGRRAKEVLEDAVARWVDLWGIAADTVIADVDVGPETTFALLRILEEALENVRKHADATRVSVRLDTDGSQVRLTVADDGRGLGGEGAGHGLRFMAERAEALGGRLEIRSAAGTTVLAEVPRTATP